MNVLKIFKNLLILIAIGLICVTNANAQTTTINITADGSMECYSSHTSCTSGNGCLTTPNIIIDNTGGFTYSLANSAFQNCPIIQSFTFNGNVNGMGTNAFADCPDLQSITFNNNVGSIGAGAFSNCTNLHSITLTGNVSGSFGTLAFNGCTNLQSITFNGNVTGTGASAFSNCTNLQSITFNGNLTSSGTVGTSTFNNCYNLSSITITNATTAPALGIPSAGVFNNAGRDVGGVVTVYVPASAVASYRGTWGALSNVTIESIESIGANPIIKALSPLGLHNSAGQPNYRFVIDMRNITAANKTYHIYYEVKHNDRIIYEKGPIELKRTSGAWSDNSEDVKAFTGSWSGTTFTGNLNIKGGGAGDCIVILRIVDADTGSHIEKESPFIFGSTFRLANPKRIVRIYKGNP
jgi:hypothetical protein